ncbi:hypothetical protein [Sediminicoccus rosea]|jgi:hypothetical protein|uniref:Uncharacterized protein n=1 Tax=Sediminicoccus rosea TaxID=1225128 RepID=A0ABZ0PDZ1_9PROT|nr:hypothetical protein [Sediminicoccus rosea]WPB83425.1 hypothetical protein R9Z33_15085 [Sediminicoccus rosea]
MLRLLPLAMLLALPLSAQAQLANYCNGRLQLNDTTTQATPSGMEYYATVRNISGAVVSANVLYRGALTDKVSGNLRFNPGTATRIRLGRQTPGSPRLLQNQIIQDLLVNNCS